MQAAPPGSQASTAFSGRTVSASNSGFSQRRVSLGRYARVAAASAVGACLLLSIGCTRSASQRREGSVEGQRSESSVERSRSTQALITDQVHSGGAQGFFWLPPMVSQPALDGAFDGTLSPQVDIDQIDSDGNAVSHVGTFTTGGGPHGHVVEINVNGGHYQLNWKVTDFDVEPSKVYRIKVTVNARAMGVADVQIVANGSQAKNVDTGQFIPLVDNQTLPIKFFLNRCGGVYCQAPNACLQPVGVCNLTDGSCSYTPKANGTACSDGNACTQTDSCQAGACVGSNPVECTASDQCHDAGTCDPTSGICTNPAKADGTSCSDGNACTQTDSCQAGACLGASPVVCTASDQCHDAGVCDPSSGACSNPVKADGASCSDDNACTQTDSCQTGACVGASPVVCVASDQCHDPGVCDPASGVCTNPAKANGAACTDGNACTQTDTCQVGACVGASPVVCTASDQCHIAGVCNPATGVCSNPPKANGASCTDGNACTQTDSCQAGACVGASPVVCVASDQCHDPGACDPASGVCTNPAKANGAACTDGNACTQTDTCQGGACVGASPVVCTASDQCHDAGTCDPSTGACSNPAKANGTSCSDGNACTQTDSCQTGACVGASPVVCTASDQCHDAGTCDPSTGVCSNPAKANGTSCSDGNACTQTDSCQAGACVGASPVVCTASDQCHDAGTCDASTGVCSNPAKANGASCTDGNACTQTDSCQAGACVGASPVVCTASDQCHDAGACNPTTGVCSNPPKAAGSSCADPNLCNGSELCDAAGVCQAGTPLPLDDGNACTTDACDPAGGVSHTPIPGCAGLPDLVVTNVGTPALVVDPGTNQISGTVSVGVANNGLAPADHSFVVKVFEDADFDGALDPGTDPVFGQASFAQLAAGASLTVDVPVSGLVAFPGNLIWARVDADQQITEVSETNNLGSTTSPCVAPPPQPRAFEPVIESEWDASTSLDSQYADAGMAAPAVADLDGDGVPEIIFASFKSRSYPGGGYQNGGRLRAIDGRTGVSKVDFSAPIYGATNVAVGDIDQDGRPEVVAIAQDNTRLMAFEHTGALKWTSLPAQNPLGNGSLFFEGGPSLADLEGDGTVEVVMGAVVYSGATGAIRWIGARGQGKLGTGTGPLSVVADLDRDGRQEVVTGVTAYRADGSFYWDQFTGHPSDDGFPAVGNFDADPYPEIVFSAINVIKFKQHDGTLTWSKTLPPNPPGSIGFVVAGPPTIGDADGDGIPEIGIATRGKYMMLRADGSTLWSTDVNDISSGITGSTMFDFLGDGTTEVVYSDERYLRIYEGATGQVLFSYPNPSGTFLEFPLVADVDADGHAEIVVGANLDVLQPAKTGMRVFGSKGDAWVSARPIWNQHSYHITNVNDDGTIPANEVRSWESSNTYRLNREIAGTCKWSRPDLVASMLRVSGSTATVRVANVGADPAKAGLSLSFYDGRPGFGGTLLTTVPVPDGFASGQYRDLSASITRSFTELWASADDKGGLVGDLTEVNEYNNLATVPGANRAPTVDAGPDINISISATATLDARLADDGLPSFVNLQSSWTVVDGPGLVTFTDSYSRFTKATFSAAGLYTLRLTVSDGQLSGQDDVRVTVDANTNIRPTISCESPVVIEMVTTVVEPVVGCVVNDDGRPTGLLSFSSAVLSGPGSFLGGAHPAFPGFFRFQTTTPGNYVVRLTVSDGQFSHSQEVPITVLPRNLNTPPTVALEPDLLWEPGRPLNLNAVYTDDGRPVGGPVSVVWSLHDGPAPVTFTTPTSLQTDVVFTQLGKYELQVRVSDGQFATADWLSVTVVNNPPNAAPLVDAGPANLAVILPARATLNGSVSDDRRPYNNQLNIQWTVVSGPAPVTFVDPNSPKTEAIFAKTGTYWLRLTANDGQFSVSDQVEVAVFPVAGTGYSLAGGAATPAESLVNLEHVGNVLKLKDTIGAFNHLWVAVTGKGTIVKIDAESGRVLAEYNSSPATHPKSPSALTVDRNGGVWVANQAGNSVVHIGSPELGQCVDRNFNGGINTSSGLGDIRGWSSPGASAGGVATAVDECILHYVRLSEPSVRHLSVDANNDIWVSGNGQRNFVLLDGVTGAVKRTEATVGYGGNGGLVDGNGVLWSANRLLRWDPVRPLSGPSGGNWMGFEHDSYGLCLDPEGNVWNTSSLSSPDGAVRKFSPAGDLLGTFAHGSSYAEGCVGAPNGHLWVAHSRWPDVGGTRLGGRTVARLKPDGSLLGIAEIPGSFAGAFTANTGPTGVAVDSKGRIWTTNQYTRTVSRIDPNAGPMGSDGITPVGRVDFTSPDLGGTLDNRSDLSGSTLRGLPSAGGWSFVRTNLSSQNIKVIWQGRVCGDGKIGVRVDRSVDANNIGGGTATNGQPSAFGLGGAPNVRVTVTLTRSSQGVSPEVHNVHVGSENITFDPVRPNASPEAGAGPDRTFALTDRIRVSGFACDDVSPLSSGFAMKWSKVSGPGDVTFATPNGEATDVTVTAAGVYVLRLTANDNQHLRSDDMTLTVVGGNRPPVLMVSTPATGAVGAPIGLSAVVSDDGLPVGGSVTTTWSKVSGPGNVVFANATDPLTSATFDTAGSYVVRLTATDGQLTSSADVAVSVGIAAPAANSPPVVAIPSGLQLTLPERTVTLAGTVTDDGRPTGASLSYQWMLIDGPPGAFLSAPSAATTQVTLPQIPGTYVVRLSASDSQLAGSATGTIVLNPASSRNLAPVVSVGPNLKVPNPATNVVLPGAVQDDGLPAGAIVGTIWRQVSGPATVTFADSTSATTTASFPVPGSYVLQLLANDSQYQSGTSLVVEVHAQTANQPPSVAASNSSGVVKIPPGTMQLAGTVTDDGQPTWGTLTIAWSTVSGPANVVFSAPSSPSSQATFSTIGDYVLRLTASDAERTSFADVAVTVVQDNAPPSVNAGPDVTLTEPAVSTTLAGTVIDDGRPLGSIVAIQWVQVSGPAPARIDQPGDASTPVTVGPTAGAYVFALQGWDGQLLATDTVTVTLNALSNQPPVVNAGPDLVTALPNRTVTLTGTATDDGRPIGVPLTISWAQMAGPAPVQFGNRFAANTTATFDTPGTYMLTLSAHDSVLSRFDQVTVVVQEGGATNEPPTVSIASPLDLAEVTEPVSVVGSVAGEGALAWRLETREVDAAEFSLLAAGEGPVGNGALGSFDPTLLLNGMQELRLVAVDTAGRQAQTSIKLMVKDQMKLGHVALTFEDLSVPLSGIPIQVLRSYDSRDTKRGDFGFGWTLDINRVRVFENTKMGEGFRVESSGGTVQTFCIVPARRNVVMVVTPDGDTHRFEVRLTDNCDAFQPPDFVSLDFQPLPGTTSTLEAQGNNEILWVQGELLDENGQVLDPRAYVLTLADGRELYFDQFSGFQQIKDLNDNSVVFGPNGVVHSSGRSMSFQRDTQGRITRITDPDGKFLQYSYDLDGNLAKVTDRGGNQTRFTYYAPTRVHHLRDIIDPRGIRAIRNDYDAAGRLLSTSDPLGLSTTFGYDVANRKQTIIDRLGNTRTLEYNAQGFVTKETDQEGGLTTRTYDDLGNQLSETDATGRTRSWTYDAKNNVLTATDPDGKTTTHTYGPFGRRLTTTDPLGHTTTNTYDAAGNLKSVQTAIAGDITRFSYDSRGKLTERLDALGHVTQYGYDTFGNQTSEIDTLGKLTTRTFDNNGRALSQTRIRTVNGSPQTLITSQQYDSNGRGTRTTYPDGSLTTLSYDAAGNVVMETDQLGRTTRSTFDSFGRLAQRNYADGTFESFSHDAEGRRISRRDRASRITSFTYDKTGRVIRTTHADGTFTQASYDLAGRQTSSTDARGKVTVYGFDQAGRRTTVTDPLGHKTTYGYDAAGNNTSIRDPRGFTTSFTYDAANRRTVTTFPDTTQKTTGYDLLGRRTSETDQAGRTTSFGYDFEGQLTSVTDALMHVTSYAYDEVGNRVSQTDANKHVTRFEYDRLGRQTKRILPDGKFETKTYHSHGLLAARTDFMDRTTTFLYDESDRLIRKVYPDSSAVSFTYTPTGGRLTAVDARGTTSYVYDQRDRPMQVTYPDGRRLNYTYDANDNRTSLTATVGATSLTTSLTYNDRNQVSVVTDPEMRQYSYTYNPNGAPESLAQPNGVTTTYAYDNLDRLTNLTSKHGTTPLASYTYTLGLTGRRDQVVEADGTTRAYGYDQLDRLRTESVTGAGAGNYSKAFEYDPVGNRTTQMTSGAGAASVSYTYDSRDRLLSETGVAYGWDQNGNLVSRTGDATYEWDFEDRLTKVTKADGAVVEHVYDVDGNRIETTVTLPGGGFGSRVVTKFLVDTMGGLSQVVLETDEAGSVGAYYVRAGADLLSVRRGSQYATYLKDGLGSVRGLADANGAVAETRTYSAYGETLASTESDGQPFGFAGQAFEKVSGLSYNRARWMDVKTGTFLSMDPWAGNPQSPATLARYLYGSGNPVDNVDPSGHMSVGQAAITVATFTVVSALANVGLQPSLDRATVLSAAAEGAKQGFEFGVAFVLAPAVIGALGVAQGIIGIPGLLGIIDDPSSNTRQKLVAAVLLVAALDGALGYRTAATRKPPIDGDGPMGPSSIGPSAKPGSTPEYRGQLGTVKKAVEAVKQRRDQAREAIREFEDRVRAEAYTSDRRPDPTEVANQRASLTKDLEQQQKNLDNAFQIFNSLWREYNRGITGP
jgi:RHS repeat-associated protein